MIPDFKEKKPGRREALTALSSLSEEKFNKAVSILKKESYLKKDIKGNSRQEREESVIEKAEETLISSGMERRHAWEAVVSVVAEISG